jgi:hypothetical protein
MRSTGLFGLWRHYPDIVADGTGDLLGDDQAVGINTVVIGDQDAHQILPMTFLPPI